ncbi:phosphopantothenoylcysteine decarboxylase / phosphopantothenate--cysteine ligase [Carboxydocella sporoproducens DSM 16521]|uniref:Coenzyme A biosynthesis bifunctional protein CoaBC n=2 Tax=Carboxydocella TaxID=178898 RepID=A0A1T4MUX2_9FIRM|nr:MULTISPECIES: bifunctional phosphopantothenoylcysteine decarboxylase/phosphopantothenate--cysteine ligase CoaBC [Carboxydocella]AVX20315.1 phosphopantothenoylcysteine decarboxylase / phosphopantothenate--cysteine ligase [Carboxydocella thermautotrophica]GAW30114.1 phosphopantothenoylcysteine decarboxylase [Carboxydocella sp. ULO1]SJZ70782.1 phosphopantothenoylcysteine decarboxylase / phosphopantothenate--cysteine ligase [Carboxydocella sporoproducens DSM 16521]
MWQGKRIIVGITGGIAAYKAADLVSQLVKAGAEVRVIMTPSAQKFITPLTLQTLSRQPVGLDMFAEPKAWEVQHIAWADWAQLVIVAPATANTIGKLAHGLADNLLTAVLMATRAPILLAPAMNVHMWENPLVQANLEKLQAVGVRIVEPESGRLACGYEGKGRMAAVNTILEAAALICWDLEGKRDLTGRKVLITAGGTREPLDPVRFIANRSSGKMGYALATEAVRRGGQVVLVSGPVELAPPPGLAEFIRVERAEEMAEAVLSRAPEMDVIIKAAAVADFRPVQVAEQKVKKGDGDWVLHLQKNPDILAILGARKRPGQVLVGFAAETHDLLANGAEKARRKGADFIVANDVSRPGSGFGSDTNEVTFIFPDGATISWPLLSKQEVAARIFDQIVQLLGEEE